MNETLSNAALNLDISIAPNPSTGFVSIHSNHSELDNTRLVIFNVLGKVVLNRKITHKSQKLNLDHLDKGVYIYQIIQNETDVIRKERLILN